MSERRDPLAAAVGRWGAAAYLTAMIGVQPITMLVGYLAWRDDGRQGFAQLVVYVVGVAAGFALWFSTNRRAPARGLGQLALLLLGLLWLMDCLRLVAGNERLNPLWVSVPVLIAMVWSKPPSKDEAAHVITSVAVILAAVVWVALAAEVLGLAQDWRTVQGFSATDRLDDAAYWLPLKDLLGLDGRWAGSFPHPNMAGPVGGFLIVVGLCRRGLIQAVLLVTGLGVLLLAASRTSMVGALAGAAAITLTALLWERRLPVRRWIVMAGTLAVLATVFVLSTALGGSSGTASNVGDFASELEAANGRSSIWPTYLGFFLESPWYGVPQARITLAMQSGELPPWATTPHSLLIDAAVRFGVVGAVLVALTFSVIAVAGVRAAASGVRVGIGLLAVVVAGGLTDNVVIWREWSASTIILLLAVVATLGQYPPVRSFHRGTANAGEVSTVDPDLSAAT